MTFEHVRGLIATTPRTLIDAFATVRQAVSRAKPNRVRALRDYRKLAQTYEWRTEIGDPARRELVDRLAPRPGEVIADVGCGTGRNFDRIVGRVGAHGRLIGVEPSPQMVARARALVERRGWKNVELVCACAEDVVLPATADAAIMCAVHDVMRSPAALTNVLSQIHDGGRIVAGGPKWVPWRRAGAIGLNLSIWRLNRGCISTFEGFAQPWSRLAELVPDLRVEEHYTGAGYIASGTVRRA
jgi:SAM-dependent methyltransferase